MTYASLARNDRAFSYPGEGGLDMESAARGQHLDAWGRGPPASTKR